jgi:hypothetical protein
VKPTARSTAPSARILFMKTSGSDVFPCGGIEHDDETVVTSIGHRRKTNTKSMSDSKKLHKRKAHSG